MNFVCNELPFHMICDWGVNPLPSTVSRTKLASLGRVSGESEVIWGCGTAARQLTNIALQVQPDNSRGSAAMRAMRTHGKGFQGLTREERIRASLLRALISYT